MALLRRSNTISCFETARTGTPKGLDQSDILGQSSWQAARGGQLTDAIGSQYLLARFLAGLTWQTTV
jgi:hypothetical protein